MAIKSVRGSLIRSIIDGKRAKRFPTDLVQRAENRLALLEAATSLDALRIPPGNRLEALSGDRKGQFSIRINSQWRVCFGWDDGNAYHVEIVDYH
ncbi:MAG: type II toxin-antitoxin system RelE/ParE family toxin [Pseudomonadota bacterium]